MTNLEVIKNLDDKHMAAFLLDSYHVGGWDIFELIKWLNQSENITDRIEMRLAYEDKIHVGGIYLDD